MPVEDYLPEWEAIWDEVEHKPFDFFAVLLDRDLIDQELYTHEALLVFEEMAPEELVEPEVFEGAREKIGDALFERSRGYFATAFHEVLVSLWQWMLEKMKDLINLVVGVIRPVWDAVWATVDGVTQATSSLLFTGLQAAFAGHETIRPEDAWPIAANLYSFALKQGVAAHATALGAEIAHPIKHVGLGSIPAMIGEFAGFSRVSAASLGILMSRVLAQAMTYNVQKKYRPVQPDDMMLQIMAVKPDITNEQFRKGMAYMGYSEEWIDSIQQTMYHEPRYFELKMMSEDEAATDEWLRLKSRRAGFTEKDTDVMVRSYVKQASRMQRVDYYRQSFYMYKEGYITHERFEELLVEMELRPEALYFARRGAEMAYLSDYLKDMISLYTDSFMKDLIDDDELLVSLLSLGMAPQRAWLVVAKSKIRKTPKPRRVTITEEQKAAAVIQKKYVQLYIQQFRKELITTEKLLTSLLAIGITRDLAEVTVAIEDAKKGLPTPEI